MTRLAIRFWRGLPWFDAQGRLSALKIACLVAVCLPALWMGSEFSSGRWDFPSPYVSLIYHSGLWATYILLACLAVTPLRRITGFGRLAQLRRLLGVASFCYCLLHLLAWFGLRFWDWSTVAAELAGRPSLWIATASLLILLALALTSLDIAMRCMGRRWKQLHRLVYVAALLAVVHFLMSPGSLQGLPFLMAGSLAWLMGWRALEARRNGGSPMALLALGTACALFAMLLQPVWLATFQVERTSQTPLAALADNFNLEIWKYLGIPPVWLLLAWALATTLIAAYRSTVTLPKAIS